MPRKLKTRCRVTGCTRLTRTGYCEQHQTERYRRPADQRRGSSAARGYNASWRRVRELYYQRHPLCEDCLAAGRLNDQQIEVDHIIPIDVRPDLRLSFDNLRSRCRHHHQLKTLQDKQQYGTVKPGGPSETGGPGETGGTGEAGGRSKAADPNPETTRPTAREFPRN